MVKKDVINSNNEGSKKLSKKELDQALIENFISLQKVLTNLSIKFEELSNNINKLLETFEISAKDLAEKYKEGTLSENSTSVDNEFLKKLDSLLDQNKTIAKGIMLMEEKIRQKNLIPQTPIERQIQPPIFKEPANFSDLRFKQNSNQI